MQLIEWRDERLVICIGCVEGDPQKDEPPVVIGRLFGPSDPANRAVYTESHGFRESGAKCSLLRLQQFVVEGHWSGRGALAAHTRQLLTTGPDQALTKPLRQILVPRFTTRDIRDGVRDHLIVFDELVAASLSRQLHQIQGGSLVAIRESVIRDDP